MKKVIVLSFFVLGFTSLISQVVIIREIAMSFYGNEFFIGWVLFVWLFWTGFGSYLENRFSKTPETAFRWWGFCHIAVALLFPFMLALIRSGKLLLGTPAGAVPDLFSSLAFSCLALGPFCLILGFQFAVTARCWVLQDPETRTSSVLGRSYLYETFGFIAGGTLFSYAFVFANEFKVAFLLMLMNFTSAGILFYLTKNQKRKIFLGLCLIFTWASVGIFFAAEFLQRQTARWHFPTEQFVEMRNTVHGNLAVTRVGHQYNFYQNGLLLGAGDERLASENLVHFPMLIHEKPKKVLLIGTGFNGVLREILKYQPDRVQDVELDPAQVEMAKKYISLELRRVLDDKRVAIWTGDIRDFFRKSSNAFDVVIVNEPNPSTVLINRQYTTEFFQWIKEHLSPGGIVAVRLKFAPDYITSELENLAASVYKTLKRSFSNVLLLPEDTLYVMASMVPLMQDPTVLVNRLESRGIRNDFVTSAYIRYRLGNDRVAKVRDLLEKNSVAKINEDSTPRGYFYEFLYWVSSFHLTLARFFFFILKVPFAVVLGVLLSGMLGAGFFLRARLPASTAMASGGFSLMATEIILIYGFQVFFGNLYYRIAWIITAFMAGMGFGVWIGNCKLLRDPSRMLSRLHVLTAGYFLLLTVGWWFLSQHSAAGPLLGEGAFLLMAGLIGGLVGLEFSWVTQYFVDHAGAKDMRTGKVYAADLFGSCLGAFLTASFFIPVWGVYRTLIFLAFLNGGISLLLLFGKNLGRKNL
ncbi:MAG TPA: fused MFS/spermidine synthase [Candidatus Omnitrophota bacterium]|nr:fused MFS/spermidine synthase [Candidatus Omnitrophota bacterium]